MGIRTDLYNLFKSYGFVMQLYDVDGNGPTLAIEEAEYIYCRRGRETYMVVVNDNSNSTYKKLTIYKTAETSKKDFREMLINFKRIVAKNSFTLTIKNFGKTIVPKDFSVLPKLTQSNKKVDELEESFKVKGFKKTSHFVNENARVIVKHKTNIDEKKSHANSRRIKEVWVATRAGERRKVSESNLTLGKAIANHINQGGSLYDDMTNKLIGIGDDLESLKKFKPLMECDDEKATSVKQLVREARQQVNKFLTNLSKRKKQINEEDLPSYDIPEHSFTKAFYADMCDDDTADKLAKMSIFISFLK